MKKNTVHSKGFRQLGQGMTEYIIIVALVAVAGIASYKLFGQTVRNQLAGLGDQIAGQTATGLTQAQASATKNNTNANKDKGMGAYNTDN